MERVKFSERPICKWKDAKFTRQHGSVPKGVAENSWMRIYSVSMMYLLNIDENDTFGKVVCLILLSAYLIAEIFMLVNSQRLRRYYNDCLQRGGRIIDEWNYRAINLRGKTIVSVCVILLYLTIIVVRLFFESNLSSVQLINAVFIMTLVVFCVVDIVVGQPTPTIFLPQEYGLIFGGALLPYKVLQDIEFKGNDFHLKYEGKEVASGRMRPDDADYLQEMLELDRSARGGDDKLSNPNAISLDSQKPLW